MDRSSSKSINEIQEQFDQKKYYMPSFFRINLGVLAINMPWVPNELDGKLLLNEVMLSGNFGKQDERMKNLYDSKWNSFWKVHFKTFRFYRFDHSAWFWSPMWRIYTFFWRMKSGYNNIILIYENKRNYSYVEQR